MGNGRWLKPPSYRAHPRLYQTEFANQIRVGPWKKHIGLNAGGSRWNEKLLSKRDLAANADGNQYPPPRYHTKRNAQS
jgi:hypothetical protein